MMEFVKTLNNTYGKFEKLFNIFAKFCSFFFFMGFVSLEELFVKTEIFFLKIGGSERIPMAKETIHFLGRSDVTRSKCAHPDKHTCSRYTGTGRTWSRGFLVASLRLVLFGNFQKKKCPFFYKHNIYNRYWQSVCASIYRTNHWTQFSNFRSYL